MTFTRDWDKMVSFLLTISLVVIASLIIGVVHQEIASYEVCGEEQLDNFYLGDAYFCLAHSGSIIIFVLFIFSVIIMGVYSLLSDYIDELRQVNNES